MELWLRNKTIIVTGGASNIGRGITHAFAREGSNIVIADIDKLQAERVASEALGLGASGVLVVKMDVTSAEQAQQMVEETISNFEKIDVLVNNAGAAYEASFIEKSRDSAAWELDLNMWGVINCTRAVLHHMVSRKSGSIVNITSHCARQGYAGWSYYSLAKAGVTGLTQAIAREVGGYGIRLNCVAPGVVPPTKPEEIGECSRHTKPYYVLEKAQADIEQRACIKRLGRAEDIANAVIFLASECAGYITGQTISVDGGLTFH